MTNLIKYQMSSSSAGNLRFIVEPLFFLTDCVLVLPIITHSSQHNNKKNIMEIKKKLNSTLKNYNFYSNGKRIKYRRQKV